LLLLNPLDNATLSSATFSDGNLTFTSASKVLVRTHFLSTIGVHLVNGIGSLKYTTANDSADRYWNWTVREASATGWFFTGRFYDYLLMMEIL
jgi:hypothetical protein